MLQLILMKLNELTPDPDNLRKHSKENLGMLAESLSRFGQQKPLVVDGDGVILAGNGTYQVAKDLEIESLYCVKTDLSAEQGRLYGVVDNRVTDNYDWEYDALQVYLDSLQDTDLADMLRFDTGDLDELVEEEIPEGSDASKCKPIAVTPDQREVIEQACEKLRETVDDDQLTEGRCIELICGDFLAGV